MENYSLCRLCHVCGIHPIDIFDHNPIELCHVIYSFYGIVVIDFPIIFFFISNVGNQKQHVLDLHLQVERTDNSTKICASCFRNVNEYVRKREICAETNKLMKNSVPRDGEESSRVGVVDRPIRRALNDSPIECISLTDDESDAENGETATADVENIRPSSVQAET